MSKVIYVMKSKDKTEILNTTEYLKFNGFKGVTYNQDPVDTDVYRVLITSKDEIDLEYTLKDLHKMGYTFAYIASAKEFNL